MQSNKKVDNLAYHFLEPHFSLMATPRFEQIPHTTALEFSTVQFIDSLCCCFIQKETGV